MSDDLSTGYQFEYERIKQTEIATYLISSLSALISFSVVFILIYKYNKLCKGKSFVHYVLMIAISDTFTAIGIALGFPKPSKLCTLQGFMISFFARLSWFYTVILEFQILIVVLNINRRKFLTKRYMHMFVWILNTILQSILLTKDATYGNHDDDHTPYNRCSFSQEKGSGSTKALLVWDIYPASGELYFCFSLMFMFSAIIFIYTNFNINRANNPQLQIPLIRDSWKTACLYPLALITSWLPGVTFALYLNVLNDTIHHLPAGSVVIVNVLSILNSLYGTFLALIFYCQTEEARNEWKKIIWPMGKNDLNVREQSEMRRSSIIELTDTMRDSKTIISLTTNTPL